MKCLLSNQISIVARNDSFWQGYSAMCKAKSGRLVLAVKQAYGHGASRWARVVTMASDNRGKTWSAPRLIHEGGFDTSGYDVACPGLYLVTLRSGRILLSCTDSPWPDRYPEVSYLRTSDDEGETWSEPMRIGTQERTSIHGNILELSNGDLLVAAATPGETSMRSTDGGLTWSGPVPLFPSATSLNLSVEIALVELSDGRVMALSREDTYSNLPAFAVYSDDGGRSWSEPKPTPFIAHWPDIAKLADGRHVLAYRNVGGRANSVVWCGELEKLQGFEVSSCRYGDTDNLININDEGMVLETDGSKGEFAQFFMMPHDNPAADVTVEAEIRCLANQGQACSIGIRNSGWLRIFPDHIDIEHIPVDSVYKLDGTQWHTYRFERRNKACYVYVDGDLVYTACPMEQAPATHSPCNAFGCKFDYRNTPMSGAYPMRVRLPEYVNAGNSGRSIWRSVKMAIRGNTCLGDCTYEWIASRDGVPDKWQEENLLELDYCRDAGDWGKPVIAVWPDGECFVVDYFGNGAPVGSRQLAFLQPGRGHNSYVEGFSFNVNDIPRKKD